MLIISSSVSLNGRLWVRLLDKLFWKFLFFKFSIRMRCILKKNPTQFDLYSSSPFFNCCMTCCLLLFRFARLTYRCRERKTVGIHLRFRFCSEQGCEVFFQLGLFSFRPQSLCLVVLSLNVLVKLFKAHSIIILLIWWQFTEKQNWSNYSPEGVFLN